MKRLWTLLALVALAASACAYGGTPIDPAAISVGGRSVSVDELHEQLDFLAEEPAAVQALFGTEVSVTGEHEGSYTPDAVNVLANIHLQRLLTMALADQLDVEITDESREGAREQVDEVFGETAIPESLESALVDLLAADMAVGQAVQDEVGAMEVDEAALQAAYEAQAAQQTEACVSHILTGFSDDPNDARDPAFTPTDDQVAEAEDRIADAEARLEAGESFEAVATEVSDDPGSAAQGGALGCGPPAQYVEEFAVAASEQAVGEVGEPVRTDFGFHLILVTERTTPTFEELEPQLRQGVVQEAAQERFTELRQDIAERFDVRVDPRYGTWDPDTFQIVPPAGAQDPPTLEEPAPELGLDPASLGG